jgi:hypothetical protein
MKDRFVVLSPSLEDTDNDVSVYKGAKKLPEGFEYHSHTNKEVLSQKDMTRLLAEFEND